MSKGDALPFAITHKVRDRCICLHVQRAARAVARRFDEALRPLGLTNGQFSMLMSLNRPDAARMAEVAEVLVMDRTTLTAALKLLERRGLVKVLVDAEDKRSRRLVLTPAGRKLLMDALPVWKREHALIERHVAKFDSNLDRMRADLRVLG
jgi:DNA-binding MarR family transcriptional regulator